ncbi:Sugar transferase involved in LPS biosynthesis (colanic, teichoic acid) [Lutimaribacter pacificus]|uniref:Sugar transferase involved in LPS biosynthesis (Colanic, teichoic acid) n=1 Tax=Lutimaribacter pacificus TaxID=391948 RepID=A0A1H0MA72_9RHOB|nr:sugar transferase [Lutimaribacter pacificus]SDO77116.1 Sugar transferase involved in LPS biosynthesis (colanic, teichoic acid) [Lutimaribacter pacificus]SHK99974.1 Sugar transferase involved in LPS biosynthesis (colanic, teichoic acid) [Lutimaribacter pacificus]
MTPGKRIFDLLVAILLLALLWPVIAILALAILVLDGGPVLYRSERMRTPQQPFTLWKFRTMRMVSDDSGVSGGDKAHRITRTGRFLRRTRADELPQLWNVLRGDLSFVGPRPPLRRYVELRPDLYADVLRQRPGITGLATLVYHRTEERLLSACRTADETERVYVTRCVPRKAALDRIYAARRSLSLDLRLMVATLFRRCAPGRFARRQSPS